MKILDLNALYLFFLLFGNSLIIKKNNMLIVTLFVPQTLLPTETSGLILIDQHSACVSIWEIVGHNQIVAVSVINNNQVVFLEPAEARAAFRGLAYKRYK